VPISLGVILALTMSVVETANHAEHAYYDSAIMLLFFLLLGRVLDQVMRRKTRAVAGNLLALRGETAALIGPEGQPHEVPVKAVIDFVEKRADLDAKRLGMWGVSLGGYYAPRAAAFDKRIKACIALGGPFNWGAAWDGLPELTREAFRVRSHCKTPEEARNNANTLSLEGVAQNIICPLFIVNGRLDRIVPAKDAERLAREAKGPVELMMIEDGNHIATNRAYRWRSQSADWMAEQLK